MRFVIFVTLFAVFYIYTSNVCISRCNLIGGMFIFCLVKNVVTRPSFRPHYAYARPSVRPSVRPSPNSKTKRCRKTEISLNVSRSGSNWCAILQFKRLKVNVAGRQKRQENDASPAYCVLLASGGFRKFLREGQRGVKG